MVGVPELWQGGVFLLDPSMLQSAFSQKPLFPLLEHPSMSPKGPVRQLLQPASSQVWVCTPVRCPSACTSLPGPQPLAGQSGCLGARGGRPDGQQHFPKPPGHCRRGGPLRRAPCTRNAGYFGHAHNFVMSLLLVCSLFLIGSLGISKLVSCSK